MAVFRGETDEERAAKAAQREREEAKKAECAYLESPVGQAHQALFVAHSTRHLIEARR